MSLVESINSNGGATLQREAPIKLQPHTTKPKSFSTSNPSAKFLSNQRTCNTPQNYQSSASAFETSALMLESILFDLNCTDSLLTHSNHKGKAKLKKKDSFNELDDLLKETSIQKTNIKTNSRSSLLINIGEDIEHQNSPSVKNSLVTTEAMDLKHGCRAGGFLQLLEHRKKMFNKNHRMISQKSDSKQINRKQNSMNIIVTQQHHIPISHEVVMKKAQLFKRFYDARDFPVRIQHCSPFNRLIWNCDFLENEEQNNENLIEDSKSKSVDFNRIIPLFIAGLFCKDDPYRFVAVQGTSDLLNFVPEKELNKELVKEITAGFKALLCHKPLQNVAIHLLRDFVLRLSPQCLTLQVKPIMLKSLLPVLRSLYEDRRFAIWQQRPSKGSHGNGRLISTKKRSIGSIVEETLICIASSSSSEKSSTIKLIHQFIPTFHIDLNLVHNKIIL